MLVMGALAVASGLLTALAFPKFDLGFLAWFSLAPFLFALRRAGPAGAAGLGLLFGYALGWVLFAWVAAIEGVTLPAFLAMLTPFSAYYLVFGFLYRPLSRRAGAWIIVGAPCLWVGLEYARANLFFLALPWNFLAHTQHRYLPVIQIASITGAYGVSFLLVLVNQVLSQVGELLARRAPAPLRTPETAPVPWTAHLVTVAAALLVTLVYGWLNLSSENADGHVRVAIVQANVVAHQGMSPADQLAHLRAYALLTRQATRERPELIVWPSSSLPATVGSRQVQVFTRQLTRDSGAYLLVGGAGGDKLGHPQPGQASYANSEFLISPSGEPEGEYHKIRLTPFNEYLPLAGLVRWPQWITTLPESFVAGTEAHLFQAGPARFGAPICGENAFPDVHRRFVRDGANLMVTASNEDIFGRTSAPYQSLAMNVFRAVENRVAVARAATTGVSAFIQPTGAVEKITDGSGKDLFVAGVMVRDLPLVTRKTFYTLYGDVFAQAAVAATALMLVLARLAHKPASAIPVPRSAPGDEVPA